MECRSAKAEITYRAKSDDILLYVDESQISRIFINLVKNAIQAKAHHIMVSATIDRDDAMTVRVINDGEPITLESQTQIFIPFFSTKAEGSGKSLDSKGKASAIKGLRWVLLGNGEQLASESAEQRLKKALSVNAELSASYYLKEGLRRVWNQADKESAKTILNNWIMEARESGVRHMKKLADTIELHADGILAYYDYRISSGKVEGVNNKIKTIKRQAYGFRDDDYFKLRILSLHDDIYAKL